MYIVLYLLILPNNLQLPIISGPSLTCFNVSAVQFRSVIAYIYTIVYVNHSLVSTTDCCMSLDSSPINFYIN